MKKLLLLFLLIPTLLWAAPPSRVYTYTSGDIIDPAKVTANEDAIFNYLVRGVDTFTSAITTDNILNGTIENADISGTAAITDTKLAQITTASKVHGSSLTGLASIPSGAGVIPAANLTSVLDNVYPIGCIYTSTVSTNPATVFGFGTWTAFGAGRVLVGNGTSDAAYAAGATGGESTHTLSEAEMPSHSHLQHGASRAPAGGGAAEAYSASTDSGSTGVSTGTTGSGTAHNNLQPYIVVYFWTRTA